MDRRSPRARRDPEGPEVETFGATALARATPLEIAGMPEVSDESIVARVLAGETSLFEALMRRHNQAMYRVARGALGDDDEAVDAVQDAYVRAYRNLAGFRGDASFKTWVLRILVHECGARRRKRRRFVALDGSRPCVGGRNHADDAHPGPDPERAAHGAELRRILEGAIDALPADYRLVLVLREVERRPNREVADLLGLSGVATRVRLHRAKRMLRAHLEKRTRAEWTDLLRFGLTRCDRLCHAVMVRVDAPSAPDGAVLADDGSDRRSRRPVVP